MEEKMTWSTKQRPALAAAATVIALGCSNLAQAGNAVMVRPKKATIALLDGYGGNSWRQVTTLPARRKPSNAPASRTMNMLTAKATPKSRFPTSRPWPPRASMRLVVFPDAGPAMLPA
jgi:hypothetical protein